MQQLQQRFFHSIARTKWNVCKMFSTMRGTTVWHIPIMYYYIIINLPNWPENLITISIQIFAVYASTFSLLSTTGVKINTHIKPYRLMLTVISSLQSQMDHQHLFESILSLESSWNWKNILRFFISIKQRLL